MCTPAVSHSARIVTPSSVRFKPELLGRFITLNGTLTVIAVHNVSLVFQDLFLFFSPSPHSCGVITEIMEEETVESVHVTENHDPSGLMFWMVNLVSQKNSV